MNQDARAGSAVAALAPAVLALTLLPAPASALTPEELVATWRAQAEAQGLPYMVETQPGPDGSLRLRNVAPAAPEAAPFMAPDSPFREATLTPLPDGSVQIASAVGPSFDLPGAPGQPALRIEQAGFVTLARVGADGLEYEFRADRLRVASIPPSPDFEGNEIAVELLHPVLHVPGELPGDGTVEVRLSVDGYAYAATLSAWDSSQASRVEGEIAATFAMTIPDGVDLLALGQAADPGQAFLDAFRDGLAGRFEIAFGTLRSVARYDDPFLSYSYEMTSEPGRASYELSNTALALAAEGGRGTFSFSSSELPISPIEVSMGSFAVEIRLPVGSEVGDLRYRVALEELTLDEGSWAFLDPAGLLPHDPARLDLDIGGRAGFDLVGQLTGGRPPVIESMELRRLDISAAGLRVTGTGSFAFDTVTGQPVPTEATATARIEGLDRLLDALVATGWLTPQDARDARIGLATIFRPGEAPDTREATIEMREDGSVFANGVQIQ